MKTTKYLLLISTVIFLAASCNKDDTPPPEPELPPLTTEGLNTLGCYINGEPWVAEIPPLSEITGLRRVKTFYNTGNGKFSLFTRKKNKDNTVNQKFNLIASFKNKGLHNLDYYDATYSDFNNSGCIDYELDTLQNHTIEIIHLDTINKTISGKFEFSVFKKECQDTLTITDGRFDVYY